MSQMCARQPVDSSGQEPAGAGAPASPLPDCVTLDESLTSFMLMKDYPKTLMLLKSVTVKMERVNFYKMLKNSAGQ